MWTAMKIKLLSIEDNINVLGFRKIASQIKKLNADTSVYYVTVYNFHSIRRVLFGRMKKDKNLSVERVDEIVSHLADADIVGISSMTGYAPATKDVFRAIRQKNPKAFLIWGGIHPIIHPEDAIQDVDAICNGEGELAFEEFFDLYRSGKDYRNVRNFWFNQNGHITRNPFRPLQTQSEMDQCPQTYYGEADEVLYCPGKGFQPLSARGYLAFNGLGYNTIWTIGCPFQCTYCGNTKFIENDSNYRKLRHTSVSYMIEEVRRARQKHPFISSVNFHDDSFMALPTQRLEEFADAWKREIQIPFFVGGVIPNYVRKDKFDILVDAGMNKIRMGIQSGSPRLLQFYERPSPPERIIQAGEVIADFKKWTCIPNYDIITDNPVETKPDLLDTLELLYRLERPYHLNIYSLRVIPNTRLEQLMKEHKVNVDDMSSSYFMNLPTWNNVLLNLIAFWRPPRWLFVRLIQKVQPCGEKQKQYPLLFMITRTIHFIRTGLNHLRFMDFTFTPGIGGWILWRLGIISFWHKYILKKYCRAVV